MGRHKKHTAASLKRGVAAYWKKISYDRAVVHREAYETGKGVAYREVIAKDENGKTITRRDWLQTPSLAGLCLHLKISRDTWAEYGKDPEMGPIVQEARLVVEDYWSNELGNDSKGARFALEANMGWGDRWTTKQEIVHDAGTTLEEFLRNQGEGSA